MPPPTYSNENKRLQTLKSYNVLDTDADVDFTEIVELASAICDVPISLISFVDEDRQWFKARVGFERSETGLEESVCAHAILENDYLEVSDMGADPRTATNPLRNGVNGVNFYAGANLVAPNGMPIGTLCVLDTKPRQLTPFQQKALKTLSKQVVKQLELLKRLQIEETLRNEIDHRVKNSFQTIASVLRLSMRQVTDDAATEVLQSVERRLTAVAALHTELMGKDESYAIDATHYLGRVQDLLQQVVPDQITITVTAADCQLEQRKASALGMIVSEFVANSAKHAFGTEAAGEIVIELAEASNGLMRLTCRDNGTENARPDGTAVISTGLGEQIMASAALQLGGELHEEFLCTGAVLIVEFKAA